MISQIISFLADSEIVAVFGAALTGIMAFQSVSEVFQHRKALETLMRQVSQNQPNKDKLNRILEGLKKKDENAAEEATKVVSDEAKLLPTELRKRIESGVHQASAEGRTSFAEKVITGSMAPNSAS